MLLERYLYKDSLKDPRFPKGHGDVINHVNSPDLVSYYRRKLMTYTLKPQLYAWNYVKISKLLKF